MPEPGEQPRPPDEYTAQVFALAERYVDHGPSHTETYRRNEANAALARGMQEAWSAEPSEVFKAQAVRLVRENKDFLAHVVKPYLLRGYGTANVMEAAARGLQVAALTLRPRYQGGFSEWARGWMEACIWQGRPGLQEPMNPLDRSTDLRYQLLDEMGSNPFYRQFLQGRKREPAPAETLGEAEPPAESREAWPLKEETSDETLAWDTLPTQSRLVIRFLYEDDEVICQAMKFNEQTLAKHLSRAAKKLGVTIPELVIKAGQEGQADTENIPYGATRFLEPAERELLVSREFDDTVALAQSIYDKLGISTKRQALLHGVVDGLYG